MRKGLLFSLLIALSSCSNEDPTINELPQNNCDQSTVISSSEYAATNANLNFINQLNIVSNCLKVDLADSGCDGNSWTYKLVTDGVIDYTTVPATRKLKLEIINPELCLAIFNKQRSFDIENLKVNGQSSVKLIIEYFNHQTKEITYNY